MQRALAIKNFTPTKREAEVWEGVLNEVYKRTATGAAIGSAAVMLLVFKTTAPLTKKLFASSLGGTIGGIAGVLSATKPCAVKILSLPEGSYLRAELINTVFEWNRNLANEFMQIKIDRMNAEAAERKNAEGSS